MKKTFQKIFNEIKKLNSKLYKSDFLLTWNKSKNDLDRVLLIAEALKLLRDNGLSARCFDSGLAVSLFRDNSTRTRFSYASAANLLGLEIQDLDETKSQISHGETIRETANMISFLSEFIGIRDDMYLGEGNKYMREVGESLDDGYKNMVLPHRPGIINLQCDIDHPTQSMADLLHLKKYFGSLDSLKGKKVAMTWAYSPSYGKPLSVPQGIIALMTRYGMNVELAHPEGYELLPDVVKVAKNNANESGGSFNIVNSMDTAFRGADIVYPKSWAPYAVMQQRTDLLKNNDKQALVELEKQCLVQNSQFTDWECTEEKMQLTKDSNALYMHCLPADISNVSCDKGEVQKEVFEKYRIETYIQAGYKPYIIASMMLNNRFKNPEALLDRIVENQVKSVMA